jgi:hypothetical protein
LNCVAYGPVLYGEAGALEFVVLDALDVVAQPAGLHTACLVGIGEGEPDDGDGSGGLATFWSLLEMAEGADWRAAVAALLRKLAMKFHAELQNTSSRQGHGHGGMKLPVLSKGEAV